MKGCTQQSAMQPSGPDTINPDSRETARDARFMLKKQRRKAKVCMYVGLQAEVAWGKSGSYLPGWSWPQSEQQPVSSGLKRISGPGPRSNNENGLRKRASCWVCAELGGGRDAPNKVTRQCPPLPVDRQGETAGNQDGWPLPAGSVGTACPIIRAAAKD